MQVEWFWFEFFNFCLSAERYFEIKLATWKPSWYIEKTYFCILHYMRCLNLFFASYLNRFNQLFMISFTTCSWFCIKKTFAYLNTKTTFFLFLFLSKTTSSFNNFPSFPKHLYIFYDISLGIFSLFSHNISLCQLTSTVVVAKNKTTKYW